MTISKKPILITGSIRSGTTWVGKMIAQSPSIGYIHEPFNLKTRPGICNAKFDYWYSYISKKNEFNFYENIRKTINFSYDLIGELKSIRNPKDSLRLVRDFNIFLFYRLSYVRPLIKDPIAIFSAEWLASKFNMDVIVLIRHPAAFANSIKRKNWRTSFSHFLKQPLLMKYHLYPFEAEIRKYAEKEYNVIDQAILLWRLIHHVIIKYKKNHKDWIFLRHEDISRNPIDSYQTLFEKLNLKFSKRIMIKIKKYSNSANPSDVIGNGESLRRDSKSNIWTWKRRLTKSEIENIRFEVEDISRLFYSDKDW